LSKINVEIKTSGDFENDPEGAMEALSQTGFMIFFITKSWYDDKRSQKEWRFAKDLEKPMIYIITKDAHKKFGPEMFTPNLVATINHYGDMEKTSAYLQAFIGASKHLLEKEIKKKN